MSIMDVRLIIFLGTCPFGPDKFNWTYPTWYINLEGILLHKQFKGKMHSKIYYVLGFKLVSEG